MYRTPNKDVASNMTPTKPDKTDPRPSVRTSIGEWEKELGRTFHLSPSPSSEEPKGADAASKLAPAALPAPVAETDSAQKQSQAGPLKTKQAMFPKTAEARRLMEKAKSDMDKSGNIKRDIKASVKEIIEKLYRLVRDVEQEKKRLEKAQPCFSEQASKQKTPATPGPEPDQESDQQMCTEKIKENTKLLIKNNKMMEDLKEEMKKQREIMEKMTAMGTTYASVAAAPISASNRKPTVERKTLHSVVVTSKNEHETGEEVLDKIRKTIDAKEGWIKVEKVRKAKDRKIIMGFGTKTERDKLKDKLGREGAELTVEEVQNKDPLLLLRDVLSVNTDEDILVAFRNQNKVIFTNLSEEDNRMMVKFRRRARNPHTGHVVISVSPTIWQKTLDIGSVHIDLQRIKVEDQSPLVQCTRCLGFGHGKRFCHEPEDLCSHCGGPHLRATCEEWLARVPPKCKNCTKANLEDTEHDAFNQACPVRRKWDALARSTVAYC
ncbi:uncharacterized protein LOC134750762 [Cydia strobilella]|uniref:uncharacterized protein LOC134750762 n=1 Tax=Cydia strobilella TaxID=1100964 RepID=UPI00300536B6